jgi:hypothetical protein
LCPACGPRALRANAAEAENVVKAPQPSRLARLGVYGFDAVEPVVLAARVTEDPLLLIGASGTGKTYLFPSPRRSAHRFLHTGAAPRGKAATQQPWSPARCRAIEF